MIQFESGERIYLIKRRHPIILKLKSLPSLFVISLISVLFLFFLFFFKPSWPPELLRIFPKLQQLNLRFLFCFLFSIFLFCFWNILWFAILDYYLNCLIVTNQRIIQTEMKSLFNVTYSSIFHDKIQDIIISVKGFLAAFFDFGDIQIETAGAFKQFIFRDIPDPEIIKQVILEAKRDYLHLQNKK